MAKTKFVHNLTNQRWVPLTKIKEFKIVRSENRWRVIAYVTPSDCFICYENPLQRDCEEWMEYMAK